MVLWDVVHNPGKKEKLRKTLVCWGMWREAAFRVTPSLPALLL